MQPPLSRGHGAGMIGVWTLLAIVCVIAMIPVLEHLCMRRRAARANRNRAAEWLLILLSAALAGLAFHFAVNAGAAA